MLGRTYPGEDCSSARALEVVGERWSLLILRDALFRGTTRFSVFQRSLGVAPNILQARLARFVEAGLMTQDEREYHLTPMGRELTPVVVALTQWGDDWVPHPDGPPIRFEHRECGGVLVDGLFCPVCERLVPSADVAAVRIKPA